jgi:taurine dioxygenase
MKVTNSSHALGATIEGLDLGQPLSDAAYEAVLRTLGERGVVRFPR